MRQIDESDDASDILTGEIRTGKEAAGNISTEEKDMDVYLEGEHGIEGRKKKAVDWRQEDTLKNADH